MPARALSSAYMIIHLGLRGSGNPVGLILLPQNLLNQQYCLLSRLEQ